MFFLSFCGIAVYSFSCRYADSEIGKNDVLFHNCKPSCQVFIIGIYCFVQWLEHILDTTLDSQIN